MRCHTYRYPKIWHYCNLSKCDTPWGAKPLVIILTLSSDLPHLSGFGMAFTAACSFGRTFFTLDFSLRFVQVPFFLSKTESVALATIHIHRCNIRSIIWQPLPCYQVVLKEIVILLVEGTLSNDLFCVTISYWNKIINLLAWAQWNQLITIITSSCCLCSTDSFCLSNVVERTGADSRTASALMKHYLAWIIC